MPSLPLQGAPGRPHSLPGPTRVRRRDTKQAREEGASARRNPLGASGPEQRFPGSCELIRALHPPVPSAATLPGPLLATPVYPGVPSPVLQAPLPRVARPPLEGPPFVPHFASGRQSAIWPVDVLICKLGSRTSLTPGPARRGWRRVPKREEYVYTRAPYTVTGQVKLKCSVCFYVSFFRSCNSFHLQCTAA